MSEAEKNPLLPEWIEPGEDGPQSRFKIRGLSGLDALELMPEISVSEDQQQLQTTGKGLKFALLRGLVDWDAHTDKNGKDFQFSIGNFDTIPPTKMRQIAMAVILKTQFTAGIEKNS